MAKYYLSLLLVLCASYSFGQLIPIEIGNNFKYCYSMEAIEEAIQNHPGIRDRWKRTGALKNESFLRRKSLNQRPMNDTLVIPIVFHLVDAAQRQAWITDRSVYDQVEILNQAYNGLKSDTYRNVIPQEIYDLTGRAPIKFVLAKQTPDGQPTTGIERRVATTPDRIAIKSTAAGGLDPWDVERYVNVWAGTLSGNDGGLLGVSTMPFLDTEGPAGVVINIATLPASKDISRQYYPQYAEGTTLIHELGHYFYLFHAFGDQSVCNNDDFRTEPGWPLTYGIDADDTPPEKYGDNISFGNPSQIYSTGCASPETGEMYGNFMNYFDDRGLFMFSNGQGNRILDCIDRYYPNLPNSNGAISLSNITDAYLVSATPQGTQERLAFIGKDVDWSVTLRNYGGTAIDDINLTVEADGQQLFSQKINPALEVGADQTISIGKLNMGSGQKLVKIYTSNPNGRQDNHPENDTIYSFVYIVDHIATAPFLEDFNSNVFPPDGWSVWNPNNNGTWGRSSTSGINGAGSATMQFINITGGGQIDEMVMPAINLTATDSALLTFDYAYRQRSNDPLTWDGLEIYASNNLGKTYELVYKKTGKYLKTIDGLSAASFQALPSETEKWKKDTINLTHLISNNPILIKFRAVNEKGNNLYIDNIRVDPSEIAKYDVALDEITQIPVYIYENAVSPHIEFTNKGSEAITKLTLSRQVDDLPATQENWEGNLSSGQSSTLDMNDLPTLTPGRHEITIYSSPFDVFPDQNPSNDTARFVFYQMGKTDTPVDESFESSGFVDPQWVIQENAQNHSWEKTNVATDGNISAFVNNYQFDMEGSPTNLFSPVITPDKIYDSLFLSLDYAYAAALDKDSLQIKITTDEGKTFIALFDRGGDDLATAPNQGRGGAFIPGAEDWDSLRFDLAPIVGNTPFQIVFSAKGYHGNNLYLDDIRIFGVTVPQLVKDQGYLFYPSPFKNQFVIRHLEIPEDLKSIRIFDASGRLVWQQSYNGNGERMIYVNTAAWARGTYIVRLDYTGRSVAGKVVKQ